MPETLHVKLGCYKQRPLGLGKCSGVSSGPCEYPAPITCPTDSSSHKGEYGSYRPGNTTNAREKRYPCGPMGELHQGFVSSIFLAPKTGGGHRPLVNLCPLIQFFPYIESQNKQIHCLEKFLGQEFIKTQSQAIQKITDIQKAKYGYWNKNGVPQHYHMLSTFLVRQVNVLFYVGKRTENLDNNKLSITVF